MSSIQKWNYRHLRRLAELWEGRDRDREGLVPAEFSSSLLQAARAPLTEKNPSAEVEKSRRAQRTQAEAMRLWPRLVLKRCFRRFQAIGEAASRLCHRAAPWTASQGIQERCFRGCMYPESEAAFELRRRQQLPKQFLDGWRFVQAVANSLPPQQLKHDACMGERK